MGWGLETKDEWPVSVCRCRRRPPSGKSSLDPLLLHSENEDEKTVAMFWTILQMTVLLLLCVPLSETLFSCLTVVECLESIHSFWYGAWTWPKVIWSQRIKEKTVSITWSHCVWSSTGFLLLSESRCIASLLYLWVKLIPAFYRSLDRILVHPKWYTTHTYDKRDQAHKQMLVVTSFSGFAVRWSSLSRRLPLYLPL